jgi:hypothetical protein
MKSQFEIEQEEINHHLHVCEQCGSESDLPLSDSIGDLFVCDVCFRKWLKERNQ